MTDALQARKRELRQRAKLVAPLDALAARVAAIEARVRALPCYASAGVVALYAALPGEVDTDGLLRELWSAGRAVVLPRLEGREIALHRVESGAELEPGRLGLREPARDRPSVAPDRVDAFLIPGLYFDRSGHRLGHGWGCYDRLLAASRVDAVRIGLCFSDRVIDAVPAGSRDESVDFVLTERESIRTGRLPA